MSFRTLARKLHLYAGLAAAPFLLLLGATGAFLEFEYPIDRLLNLRLSHVMPEPERVPLQLLLQRVRQVYPDYRIQSLDLSPYSTSPEIAFFFQAQDPQGRPATIYVDQYRGTVLGLRRGEGFAARVHDFHTDLLLGERGEAVMMTVAVLLVLLGASGLVLWWPRKLLGVEWGGSGLRLNFSLHNTLGLVCSGSLLLFGLSGFVIYWQDSWLLPATNRMLHISDRETAPRIAALPGQVLQDLDQLDAAACAALPGARSTRIVLPAGNDAAKVWMKFPDDHTALGRSAVLIDPYSGLVLRSRSSRTAPLPARYFRQWNREIHTGDLLGWPTRLLAFAAALLLPGLAVTGPLLWWMRRRRRQTLPV